MGKTHKRREIRLVEHLDPAAEGRKSPVWNGILPMVEDGVVPGIFVLRRLPPEEDCHEAERSEIHGWPSVSPDRLPVRNAPQTIRSETVEIGKVKFLNVQAGG